MSVGCLSYMLISPVFSGAAIPTPSLKGFHLTVCSKLYSKQAAGVDQSEN